MYKIKILQHNNQLLLEVPETVAELFSLRPNKYGEMNFKEKESLLILTYGIRILD